MTIQLIDTTSGAGDTGKAGGDKINAMFTELYGSFLSARLAGEAAGAARALTRRAALPVLDSLATPAIGAFGFTKLRAAYTGACCRVRRISDSAELDIPFLADGVVATALMIGFMGASELRLVTLYDQTANGYNLTQPTAASQFKIDFTVSKNGCPVIAGGGGASLVIPSGLAFTSTANCAVWKAIGNFSHRVGCTPFNMGATTNTFSLGLSPNSAFSVQPYVNGSALNFGTMQTIPNANGCVIGLNSASTGMTYYRNNYSVSRAVVTAVAAAGGVIDGNDQWQSIVFFNAALSATDATLLQYSLSSIYHSVLTPRASVLLMGDSRTASVDDRNNYNTSLSRYLSPDISVNNSGNGGSALVTHADTDIDQYGTPTFKTGIPNVAVLLSGVNDIQAGTTAATLQTKAALWATKVRTAGGKAIVATQQARNVTGGYTSAMEAQRVLYNAWLRANYGPGKALDAIADFDLEPTLLPTVSAGDYPDNLHESAQGYRKEAPIIASAILSLLPAVV